MSSPTRAVTEFVGLYAVISTSFTCQGDSHIVPVTVSLFVNFLSRTIQKMFPSVVLVLVCSLQDVRNILMARCRWFEKDLRSEVVFWYVAHLQNHSLLPVSG